MTKPLNLTKLATLVDVMTDAVKRYDEETWDFDPNDPTRSHLARAAAEGELRGTILRLGGKVYCRFYERPTPTARWSAITIDLAKA